MKPVMAILAAAFLAGPASAQFTNCTANGPFTNCFGSDGTITNCNRTGTIVNCNSMGGQQNQQSYNNNGPSAADGIVSLFRSISERRARSRVTKALQAGDCQTAAQHALQSNSVELAQLVLGYCKQ